MQRDKYNIIYSLIRRYAMCAQSKTISSITEDHNNNLPAVRIKKAILKDFKNVEYGEITFNCGRQFVPYLKSFTGGLY